MIKLIKEVAKTTPILPVFLSVFCVAIMHECYNMRRNFSISHGKQKKLKSFLELLVAFQRK